MYNDQNDQDRSGYEYHYSYRSDSDGFRPAQPPMEVTPKKKKRFGRVLALVLCGALLLGGAFGAGWCLRRDGGGRGESRIRVSDRPLTRVDAVSVTGGEPMTLSQIYQANRDSCVSINSSAMSTVGYNIFGQQIQRESVSSGSGFLLTADGYIATNCHVVENATSVQATLYDGKTYAAQVVGSDADYDIAVLKIDPGDAELKAVVLGSTASLEVGVEVSTIGNPLGELTFSMAHGVVACLDREINLSGTPFNMIQVDTSINRGNSGGPLFNDYGEVVGIVTAKTTSDGSGTAAEGLGFAIPIDDVLGLIQDIMENGQVTSRAYMGVTVANASQYPESGVRSGAYVAGVVEDGPADRAGLQEGDVITMLGTATITSRTDLTSAVGSSKTFRAGDSVTVTYVRSGQVHTTELTFGSTLDKPAEEDQPQPGQRQDNYDGSYGEGYDGYGDMEDFFRQFFGGSYGQRTGQRA